MWPRKCKMEPDWPKGEQGGAEGPAVRGPGLQGFEVRARWKGRLGISRRGGQRSEPGGSEDPDPGRAPLHRGGCRPGWAWAMRTPWAEARALPRSGGAPCIPANFSPLQRGEPLGGDCSWSCCRAQDGEAAVPERTALSARGLCPRDGQSRRGGCCPGPARPELLYEAAAPLRAPSRKMKLTRPGSRHL